MKKNFRQLQRFINVAILLLMVALPLQSFPVFAISNQFHSDASRLAAHTPLNNETPPPIPAGISPLSHSGYGPTDPPTAGDAQFVIDSGATLDSYLFRDQGPIDFFIPINRVVGPTDSNGYLSDDVRDRLINNKILSPKAQLRLMVYDVDEDYSGTDYNKEVDNVYVNGNFVGSLSGANDTWSADRLEFDIRYLKFGIPNCTEYNPKPGSAREQYLSECSAEPTAGQNEIRIDIDTANTLYFVWAVEVDWAAISFDAASPILFVHGMGGSDGSGACNINALTAGCTYWDKYDGNYWFNFRGKFSDAGYLTQITENYLGGDSHIADNAKILQGRVDLMKTRYGVKKINLVAHSKGGLDSRAYISDSSLNSTDSINSLVTLATPNNGSFLADLGNIKILADLFKKTQTDAQHDLSESYLFYVFNPTHWAKWGVKYYSITADLEGPLGALDIPWQLDSLPPEYNKTEAMEGYLILKNLGSFRGDNDILVTTSSSKFPLLSGHVQSINTFDLGTYNLNHHSIRAAEKAYQQEDSTIANKVMDVLGINTGIFVAGLSAQGADSASAPVQPQTTPTGGIGITSGTINQGQTSNQTIGVDSNSSVTFSLMWTNGDLNFNLTDPLGNTITPGTGLANVSYSESRVIGGDESLMPTKKCVYTITNPTLGNWTGVVVAASSLPGGASDWAILTTQESSITSSLATDQTWYKNNDPVILTDSLKDGTTPVTGAAVQAVITAPSGAVQTLVLLDNGTGGDPAANDGNYTTTFTAAQAGTYRFSANANWLESGTQINRLAETEVQVGSTNAKFGTTFTDGGVDTDGDGMYDILRINTPVTVSVAGSYLITGILRDSNNKDVAFANTAVPLSAGSNSVQLDFNASDISSNGGMGIFVLRDLRLLDNSLSVPLQLDYLQTAYTTQNYPASQLQHNRLLLNNTFNAQGIDTDNNGRFNSLDISVGVNADIDGTYNWNARLVDSQGKEFEWVSGSGSLVAGSNTIILSFDGKTIYSHFKDSPYYLKDLTMWGNGVWVSLTDVTSITGFSFTQFEVSMAKSFIPYMRK